MGPDDEGCGRQSDICDRIDSYFLCSGFGVEKLELGKDIHGVTEAASEIWGGEHSGFGTLSIADTILLMLSEFREVQTKSG